MRTTTMYCQERHATTLRGLVFNYFYLNTVCVEMCGPGDIIKVQVTEEPMTQNQDTYWGWWQFEDDAFVFVHPHQTLLNMCFPYGPEAEEKKGVGIRLPVKVEVLERNVQG